MEELRNLKQIYSLAAGRFNQYEGKDFVLPQLFKEQVKEINSNTITYNKYSAVIETRGNQNGVLNIFLPNQWFYIASYFTDFYNELQRYKKEALKVTSKERLKELNGSSLTAYEENRLSQLSLSEQSKTYLRLFMTDYSWWFGAKTIDRGDFYVSPILNSARLVNASQSFVAELCAFLADKSDLVQTIISGEESALEEHVTSNKCLSLQQIYYGAPGTGKSHEIKELTEGKQVIRTTFHPDSDYSTFVGAYKPTTIEVPMRDVTGKVIVENGQPVTENRIVYEFVEQAFLQAYIKAWKQYAKAAAEGKEAEEVFLVIEEINRGNCAQIFGDLFQLLDRGDDGFSEYPINADKDLQRQLAKAFEKMEYLKAPALCGMTAEEVAVKVRKGEILLLPNNLYIWATMNTSDQSLFPIDSAFKRRWDWVYMPITDAKKNYVIEIDNDQYDWWSFLTVINAIIESTTRSEDKKLGYFFAKAKDNKITADTFVGKIIFYLWNDVFKDNETNHKAFKDEDGDMLAFHKFFHDDGSVNTNVVIKFLQDLEVYPFELPDDGTAAQSVTIPNAKRQRDKSRYSVNGTDGLNKAQMTREAFRLYIDAHPEADAQEIAQVWNGLGLKDYVRHLVETEEDFNTRTKDSSDPNKRATEFELSNGEKIYLSTQFGIGNIGRFIDAVNNAGWNIRIDKQA